MHTFLVSWQTPIAIPAGDKDHIIPQVLSLDLGLLEDYDVGLQDIEHGRKGPLVSPWRMSEWVPEIKMSNGKHMLAD